MAEWLATKESSHQAESSRQQEEEAEAQAESAARCDKTWLGAETGDSAIQSSTVSALGSDSFRHRRSNQTQLGLATLAVMRRCLCRQSPR